MIKLLEIAEAWIIAENPNPKQKAIAESRIEICNNCPEKTFVDMFDTYICGICSCPLSKKIFSSRPGPEACPKQKWIK
jgi:hypothetical protein